MGLVIRININRPICSCKPIKIALAPFMAFAFENELFALAYERSGLI